MKENHESHMALFFVIGVAFAMYTVKLIRRFLHM